MTGTAMDTMNPAHPTYETRRTFTQAMGAFALAQPDSSVALLAALADSCTRYGLPQLAQRLIVRSAALHCGQEVAP